MAVLFLDPLMLGLLACLCGYVALVWRGRFRAWFARPDVWTIIAWPVPLLVLLVPALAGAMSWLLALVGVELGDGDITDAAVYLALFVVPSAALAGWPPAWLLPTWARARLVGLPTAGTPQHPPKAVPAIQARKGHGSLARWVWRVDGIPGVLSLDGPQWRFRATPVVDDDTPSGLLLDDDAIGELRFSSDGDLRLEPPRGGWWGRGHLDIELEEVDRIRVRGRVPWRRDGLLVIEVDGRRPIHLWVADIRHLAVPPT